MESTINSEVLVSVKGVGFCYRDKPALRDVSLTICGGQVLGLVGPNGAGKSTLIKLLVGELPLESGKIHFAEGVDRTRGLGFCPQEDHLWDGLTCLEQVVMMGGLYGLTSAISQSRAKRLLEQLGLADERHKLARHLSGGMRRRLSLALALIQDPAVVVLDEPEAGLDPASRREFRHLLRRLAREQERAVLIATHHLEEIEKLADQVALLHDGQLLALGEWETLVQRHCPSSQVTILLESHQHKSGVEWEQLVHQLEEVGLDGVDCRRVHKGVKIRGETTAPLVVVGLLDDWLKSSPSSLKSLAIKPGDLEEVFLRLTGEAYEQYR